jgi:hypothetical protein
VSETYELRSIYESLDKDSWRKDNPFSDEINIVNELLFDTYATRVQREEQVANWLQRFQPCVFGHVAAAKHWLHFCILSEHDLLTKSDQGISAIIRRELLEWKRRSLRPTQDFSTPAFGFVLVVSSSHLAHAAPNNRLRTFALKILELWGCEESQTTSGTMHWETLYLRDPDDHQRYLKFRFSVDFFAAQGDKRWWHDHRSPGGLLFTANSVGHMLKFREWYLKLKNQQDWIMHAAMSTIANAELTKYGKATWLKPLNAGGKPLVESLPCPFSQPGKVKTELKDKDWTRYGGLLHTDHSVRPEFFRLNPEPQADIADREYLQDFTYLYHPGSRDHTQFVMGEEVDHQEIVQKLGSVEDWEQVIHWRQPDKPQIRDGASVRTDSARASRIKALLEASRKWRLSTDELGKLWG